MYLAWLWHCGRFPDRTVPYTDLYGSEYFESRKTCIRTVLGKRNPNKSDLIKLTQAMNEISEHWVHPLDDMSISQIITAN